MFIEITIFLFCKQNEGKIPSNYKEKEKFKELIRTGYFKNEHNLPEIEENFEEALKNINNSIVKTQVRLF